MDDVQGSSNKNFHTTTEDQEMVKPKRRVGRPRKTEQQQNVSTESPSNDPSAMSSFGRQYRAKKAKPKVVFQAKNVSWKVKEKKLLLQALKNHSPNDLDAIQCIVKSKTKEEIQLFIDKMKKGIVRNIRASRGPKAPIQYWLNLLNNLTSQEKKDYTVNLGKVVSIIANFEEFPEPGPTTPNYKAIYKYLSGMLAEGELPDLGSLEAAVVLDLLHGLVDFLRSHNTAKQREIMLWKYSLLGYKVDMTDPMHALVKARKAIENDFSDLYPKNSNKTQQSTPRQTSSSSQNADESQPGTSKQSDPQSVQAVSQTNNSQSTGSEVNGAQRRKRRRTTNRTVPSDTPCPRKPTLFTMNPLCIPVDIIKMKPIVIMPQTQRSKPSSPDLPNIQTKIMETRSPVVYEVQETQVSPHPKLPIRGQRLLPMQRRPGQRAEQTSEIYVCEPHPAKLIVNPNPTDKPIKDKLKGLPSKKKLKHV
uniref:Uncharacterized protein LOC111122981 n=1 Tax=Crassostrea virginica TaxID=6565 RepID=A0A8B8CY63_CRAVI|nr:uncharacterized protein LOC111122981 [Crassostrea virginica]XP_022320743.1 uncharacterized protein LOC111122981 [Crassostrea virginica]